MSQRQSAAADQEHLIALFLSRDICFDGCITPTLVFLEDSIIAKELEDAGTLRLTPRLKQSYQLEPLSIEELAHYAQVPEKVTEIMGSHFLPEAIC